MQDLRRRGEGARRRDVLGRARHRVRSSRPERGGQDHGRAHPHHHPPAGRGNGSGPRLRRRGAGGPGPDVHRPGGPVRRRRREPHRPREPLHGGSAQPPADRGGAARATQLLDQFGLTDAGDRTPQDLFGGHAPSPGRGRRPRGPAARALSRRADHRSRPPEPHRPVGHDRGAGGRGDHGAAHHPISGGGRPSGVASGRGRPRTSDRRGDGGRAQGRPGGDGARRGAARPRVGPAGGRRAAVGGAQGAHRRRLHRGAAGGGRPARGHAGAAPARRARPRPHGLPPARAQPRRRVPGAHGAPHRGRRPRRRRGPARRGPGQAGPQRPGPDRPGQQGGHS